MFHRRWLWVAVLVLVALSAMAGVVSAEPKAKILIKPEKSELDVEVWTDRGKYDAEYFVGEYVRIYFRATQNAYINIYSIMPDGRAELVYPNSYERNNYVRAGETVSIPSRDYRLRVVGPTGTEIIQVVATRSPFNMPREWFGGDADRVRDRIESRLDRNVRDWATDWASIRIAEERKQTASVRVSSFQSGIRLYVDGQYQGTLPETVELTRGSHELVAMKEGHRVQVRNLYVYGGENETWQVRLEPLSDSKY